MKKNLCVLRLFAALSLLSYNFATMVMESDSIWYSSLSTGIFEVDIQHSNIDQLIVLLEGTKGEARIKESMDVLIHAIENHFKYEEWRFGDNSKKMNQEHINEHRRILRKYCNIANTVHDSKANEIKKEADINGHQKL